MNIKKEVGLAVLVLLFSGLALAQAPYEENIREQIFLVRPDNEYIPQTTIPSYLENEDLIFFACLEEQNISIRLSVLCTDNNEFVDIKGYKWGPENCYIGATNLEKLDCQEAIAQADYIKDGENLKLKQEIRINKFSKTLERIITSQFTDGGWDNALDTAYGLFVLSYYPEIFRNQISKAIEYLKLNRDEKHKCWPKNECRISDTANILFLLEQSQLNDDLRIQHDARIYLQKVQNYLSNNNWTVEIGDHIVNQNYTLNTSCVFDYDGNIQVINLSKYPQKHNYSILPGYEKMIGVVCTEPVYVNLYNEYSETIITYQGDNFTYDILPGCWSKNNENASCDLRSTLLALNTGIDDSRKTIARNYVNSLVVEDRTTGKHLEEQSNIINDALYLLQTTINNDDFVSYLLYTQNNNGSWNNENNYYPHGIYEISDEEYEALKVRYDDKITKQIITTSYAVMALISEGYTFDDEPIRDAQRYISLNEDKTSINITDEKLQDAQIAKEYEKNVSLVLNDTKRNAMAFYVLSGNARPLLIAEPKILFITNTKTSFDMINPTVFELEDLEYELSENLKSLIEIEEKAYLGAYSFRRISVKLKTNDPPSTIGYLKVGQSDNEYLKLPVIVGTAPELKITLPERLTFFGQTAILPFNVEKSNHDFDCSIQWKTEGISSSRPFNINELNETVYQYPVRFADITTENKVYEASINCVSNDYIFEIPISTNILRFPTKPLSIKPSVISIDNLNPKQIEIKNNVDQTLIVELKLKEYDPVLELSDSIITLYPGESSNITLEVILGDLNNFSTTNYLVAETLGIQEESLISVDILIEPEKEIPVWVMIILLVIILSSLAGASYLAYKRKDKLIQWYKAHFDKKSIEQEITAKIEQIEKEEMLRTLRNMIKILKLQGLTDKQMRDKLKETGYTDQDINEALVFSDKPEYLKRNKKASKEEQDQA